MSDINDPAIKLPAAPPAKKTSLVVRLGLFVLLTLLAAACVLMWLRLERIELESRQRSAEISARTSALENQNKLMQDSARELTTWSTAIETRLNEAANQQAQLEKLYSNRSTDEVDTLLADIEQTVSLANQQLLASGQVASALMLLQEADRGAIKSKSPNIQLIHRLLVKDIEKLKSAPLVDVAQLSSRIEAISQAITVLPLMTDMMDASSAKSGSANEPKGEKPLLWLGELQRLFRVHRVDEPSALLLTPEQGFFVRQNTKLALASSKLALLSRNESLFKSDLKKVETALVTYFDARNPKVKTQVVSLEQLMSTRIAAELPSLSETLNAVRAARSQR
jgi:uroporphyrin-III C-methyltransferase